MPITEDRLRQTLSLVADGTITAEELTDALMSSAKEVKEEDIERWKEEWAEIESIIEKEYPNIPNLAADKVKILELLASGQYAYHHSEAYVTAYKPHYRIITSDKDKELMATKY